MSAQRGMFDRGIPQTALGGALGLFLTVIVQTSGYLPQNFLVTLAGGGKRVIVAIDVLAPAGLTIMFDAVVRKTA